MQVRVLFFGILRDVAGKTADTLELPDNASVGDVLQHYGSRLPRLKELLPSLALAVNQQYSSAETTLKSGDEVALLPPVSGGASWETLALAGPELQPRGGERMQPTALVVGQRPTPKQAPTGRKKAPASPDLGAGPRL